MEPAAGDGESQTSSLSWRERGVRNTPRMLRELPRATRPAGEERDGFLDPRQSGQHGPRLAGASPARTGPPRGTGCWSISWDAGWRGGGAGWMEAGAGGSDSVLGGAGKARSWCGGEAFRFRHRGTPASGPSSARSSRAQRQGYHAASGRHLATVSPLLEARRFGFKPNSPT